MEQSVENSFIRFSFFNIVFQNALDGANTRLRTARQEREIYEYLTTVGRKQTCMESVGSVIMSDNC